MRITKRNRVVRFNRSYSKGSSKRYLELIEGCCLAHLDSHPMFADCLAFVRAEDYVGLVSFADSLSAQRYADAKTHFLANQLSSLIRKYPFLRDEVALNPEENAVKSFLRSEHRCKRINQLFRKMRQPYSMPVRFSRDYADRLMRMRSWIAYTIGLSVPRDIFDRADFGPGASIGVHGNATNVARKILSESWSVTPDAYAYASIAVGENAQLREMLLAMPERTLVCYDPILFDERFRGRADLVHNNKIVFVPKTALTHRSIAVEPLLNGFVQKSVDIFLRDRLRRVGVNLTDQKRNQELAREGSLLAKGSFSTIDLSAASDSLATEVVRELLPEDWFVMLNALRSKQGLLNGKVLTYEKFCSMGNGFCFPLESLIFASAVVEAGGKLGVDSAVYGDDIIVPADLTSRVLANLKLLGFKVNPRKTFVHGPFRESCGADWFNGEDVRPFTLDFRIDSIQSVFKLLNLVQRNARTQSFFAWLTWDFLQVPLDLRFVRPFIGPMDTAVTVELDTFLASPFAAFDRRLWAYTWKELQNDAVGDHGISGAAHFNYALLYGALRGCSSSKPFTVRRKSRTKIRRTTGSGAYATWVPAPHTH